MIPNNRETIIKSLKFSYAFFRIGFIIIFSIQNSQAQVDSTFGPERFFTAVARFHPLVRQANLLQTMAERELQTSRGQFDPKIGAMFNRKSFEGKDYYNLFNPELKIPTWPGLDVKAGFERNVGNNVSSEIVTPKTGLQYLGLGIPVGQGLWTDARRTSLKQARIGIQLAEAERQKEVNKILFYAAKDYWDWYFYHEQLQLAELAYRLARERFLAVRERVKIGEEAPIDSVEAKIFFQDRQVMLLQARVEERNARLMLSSYLWSEDSQPVELPDGAKPNVSWSAIPLINDSLVSQLKETAAKNHPELLKINAKIRQLDLERKLAQEMLKPQLNVHYSWLSRVDNSVWATQDIDRNYKLGFDFGIPLLLRKERGKLGMVKTKVLQAKLDLLQIDRNIRIEIQTNYNDLKNLENLLLLQKEMVDNYQRLRDGELKKFNNGESSLFLINSREQKLIEAKVKAASFQAKYQKEKAALLYASGRNPLL